MVMEECPIVAQHGRIRPINSSAEPVSAEQIGQIDGIRAARSGDNGTLSVFNLLPAFPHEAWSPKHDLR